MLFRSDRYGSQPRSVDVLGAVGLKRFVQMHESSYYGLKLEQVRVGGTITYLAQKSGAISAFHVRRDKASYGQHAVILLSKAFIKFSNITFVW